jgi:23S rRNA (cytosine1962-C5)-methyltransferase
MERNYPVLTVTDKAERALRAGHPWVYGEEVTGVQGAYEPGDIVDVRSRKGHWLGAGFVNDHSKIRVRILSRNANDRFDEMFWRRRIHYAVEYRRAVMGADFTACRLVFGEADGLPGLTVDRYNDVLTSEVLCL